MQPLRFGVMGCGNIADTFVRALQSEAEFAQVTAAGSRDLQRARQWSEKRGIPKGTTYEGLLSDPEIDAVYIALPNTLHAEWVKRAAVAGKHILCEKPLAANAGETVQMLDAAQRAGVVFLEAFIYRFHPQTEKIRQLLDEGVVGALRHVYATFSYRLAGPDWQQNIRARADVAGGALMDVGCYTVSFARFAFAAEPLAVQAVLHRPPGREVDFTFQATLEFEAGHAATYASMEAAGGTYARITGDAGTIDIPSPYHPHDRKKPVIVRRRGSEPEELFLGGPNGFAIAADHLAECVRTGHAPKCDASDGSANMRVIDAIRKSATSGRREPVVSA